jgi:probable HAF family extracellular repeat protein
MRCHQQTGIATFTLFAALAMPLGLAAQDDAAQAKKAQHHHYKLIEVATFGGPNSYFTFVTQTLNKHGAATGWADTPIALNPPFCLVDCFASHAFEWKDGMVIDLGALPKPGTTIPNDINAKGVVVGPSFNGGYDPALGLPYFDGVVFKDGQVIDLGTFGGPLSYAAAVNDHEQVVGFALNSTSDSFDLGDSCQTYPMPTQMRAFVWKDGVMQDLGTLGGTDSCALFVNNKGEAAGISFTNSIVNPTTGIPTIHPFLWNGQTMVDLGSLGGTLAFANGINDRGQVAGASSLAGDQTFDAFIWEKGKLIDLGNLGGNFVEVIGFSEAGHVVGKAALPGPQPQTVHAFLAKKAQIMDLGTQDGDLCSVAIGINSNDQVVGGSGVTTDCFNPSRAFLWEHGQMIDLNTFVPPNSALTLTQANSINDRGEITAQGVLPSGDQRAVLLIPCDDDHPGIEGCDYSIVDADAAATSVTATPATKSASPFVQGNPALGGAANPMMRRFGRRYGPWSRGIGASLPAFKPTSAAQAGMTTQTTAESTAEKSLSCSQGSEGLAGAEAAESAEAFFLRGTYCQVSGQVLTGACYGFYPPNCAFLGRDPGHCPSGAKAIKPIQTSCVPRYTIVADQARPCVGSH